MDGIDIAIHILDEGDRIMREKDGQALTEKEVSTVKAAGFLAIVLGLTEPKKPEAPNGR